MKKILTLATMATFIISSISASTADVSYTSIWNRQFSIHWNLLIAGVALALYILILTKDAIKGKSKKSKEM